MKNRQPHERAGCLFPYWRGVLECGGLTPLSFCVSSSISHRGCWRRREKRRHSQSGVKPPHSNKADRRKSARGGFLMLSALVCVALVVAMAGMITRTIVVNAQYDRTQLRRMQCQWLADSGIERAAARLADEPGFTGETWHIEPEQLDGRNAAVVRIAVTPNPEKPAQWTVHVQADYPADLHTRVRQTQIVHLPRPNYKPLDEEEP